MVVRSKCDRGTISSHRISPSGPVMVARAEAMVAFGATVVADGVVAVIGVAFLPLSEEAVAGGTLLVTDGGPPMDDVVAKEDDGERVVVDGFARGVISLSEMAAVSNGDMGTCSGGG